MNSDEVIYLQPLQPKLWNLVHNFGSAITPKNSRHCKLVDNMYCNQPTVIKLSEKLLISKIIMQNI